jgi:hypothetical protein
MKKWKEVIHMYEQYFQIPLNTLSKKKHFSFRLTHEFGSELNKSSNHFRILERNFSMIEKDQIGRTFPKG